MILALEFSSPRRSVAVLSRSTAGQVSVRSRARDEDAARTMKPLQLVETALREAQTQPADVSRVIVGLGPGSYTGIRSAIALAQGWQLARPISAFGISTVEALAVQAQAVGCSGPIAIVIDAQRQEFYLATFELGAGKRRLIDPLRLLTAEEARVRIQALGAVVVGPEVRRWFAEGQVLEPEAEFLAYVPVPGEASGKAEALEPIYLREVAFVKAPPPTRGLKLSPEGPPA